MCADLARLSGTPIRGDDDETVAFCPTLDEWRARLSNSPLVSDGTRLTPLVLDSKSRLYLRRYWEHERRLSEALRFRSRQTVDLSSPAVARNLIQRLFGEARSEEPDWQRIAAQIAALSRLSVISGGPGTGKTSTVTKILALAIADELARGNRRPRRRHDMRRHPWIARRTSSIESPPRQERYTVPSRQTEMVASVSTPSAPSLRTSSRSTRRR